MKYFWLWDCGWSINYGFWMANPRKVGSLMLGKLLGQLLDGKGRFVTSAVPRWMRVLRPRMSEPFLRRKKRQRSREKRYLPQHRLSYSFLVVTNWICGWRKILALFMWFHHHATSGTRKRERILIFLYWIQGGNTAWYAWWVCISVSGIYSYRCFRSSIQIKANALYDMLSLKSIDDSVHGSDYNPNVRR